MQFVVYQVLYTCIHVFVKKIFIHFNIGTYFKLCPVVVAILDVLSTTKNTEFDFKWYRGKGVNFLKSESNMPFTRFFNLEFFFTKFFTHFLK